MLAEWLIITHREPKARWESSRRYNGIIRDSSVKEMPFTRSSWNTGNIQQGKISDLRNKYMWGFIEGLECMDIQYVLKRHSCTWEEETAYFEFNVRKFSFLIIKWVPGEVVAAVKWEQAIIIVSTCKKNLGQISPVSPIRAFCMLFFQNTYVCLYLRRLLDKLMSTFRWCVFGDFGLSRF